MLDKTISMSCDLISSIMYQGNYSSVISSSLEKNGHLSVPEKKHISVLSLGVVENWILLNYYIDRLAKKRIKQNIRLILLCALFEIEFMKNNINHITVDSYVEYVKKTMPYASGFVNAILRNHIRSGEILKPNTFDEYALLYSHPHDLAELWKKYYGEEEALKIMKANQEKPLISIRLNFKHYTPEDLIKSLSKENLKINQSPYSKFAFTLDSLDGKSIESLESFKKGMFYIQDISSILLIDALNLKGNEKVLDLCSSPGGKGIGIAERLSTGSITLCDKSEKKLKVIKDNIKRLKPDDKVIDKVMINDASLLRNEFLSSYDIVLADVPCSGLGLIRKKPEIKYVKQMKNIKNMLKLQSRILEQASKYVKPGGLLVYSTCTMNPPENEERVKNFLEKHRDFTCEQFKTDSVKGNPDMIFLTSNGYSDGFYVSLLRRS